MSDLLLKSNWYFDEIFKEKRLHIIQGIQLLSPLKNFDYIELFHLEFHILPSSTYR